MFAFAKSLSYGSIHYNKYPEHELYVQNVVKHLQRRFKTHDSKAFAVPLEPCQGVSLGTPSRRVRQLVVQIRCCYIILYCVIPYIHIILCIIVCYIITYNVTSVCRTVSFHNFKSQIFKLSVSNPQSKYVAYVSVPSQISNCQGLGRKNKHDFLQTDRTMLYHSLPYLFIRRSFVYPHRCTLPSQHFQHFQHLCEYIVSIQITPC